MREVIHCNNSTFWTELNWIRAFKNFLYLQECTFSFFTHVTIWWKAKSLHNAANSRHSFTAQLLSHTHTQTHHLSTMHYRYLDLPVLVPLPPNLSLIIQPTRRWGKPGRASVISAPKHNVALIHRKTVSRKEDFFWGGWGGGIRSPLDKQGHLCTIPSISMLAARHRDWTQKQHLSTGIQIKTVTFWKVLFYQHAPCCWSVSLK